MSVKTKLDLARAVLREIRVSRYDEDPAAAYKAIVDEKYDSMYLLWVKQRRAYWPRDEIPEVVFEPVTRLVAERVAPSFNKPFDKGDAQILFDCAVARPWSGKTVVPEWE